MVADVCHWEFKVNKHGSDNESNRWYYDIECGREDKLRMLSGGIDWLNEEAYYTYSFCPFCGKPIERLFPNGKKV